MLKKKQNNFIRNIKGINITSDVKIREEEIKENAYLNIEYPNKRFVCYMLMNLSKAS